MTGYTLLFLAAAGLGLVLLVATRPDTATVIIVFLVYLNVPVVASTSHGVPKVVAANILGLLAISLVTRVALQREPIVVTPALPLMLVYGAVLLVAGISARNAEATVDLTLLFFVEGLLLYVLVTNAVRNLRALRHVIVALVAAGALMGGLSVHQWVTESYDNDYWGFAQVDEDSARAAAEGVFDASEGLPRQAGPIGSKNRYAQVLLVLIPLALFPTWTKRSILARSAAIAAAVLIMAGIVSTYSRGALVAGVALVIVMVALRYVRVTGALVGIAAVYLVLQAVAPAFVERATTLRGVEGLASEEGEDPDGAILGRATSNLAAWRVFAEHPVLGVGPGRYVQEYSQLYANQLGMRHFSGQRRAHNLYLEIAADTGILGLGAFLAVVGVTMVQLHRLRRYFGGRRPDLSNVAGVMFLALVAYLVSATFLHLAYHRYYWLLVAIANSAIWILRREQEEIEDGTGDELGRELIGEPRFSWRGAGQ